MVHQYVPAFVQAARGVKSFVSFIIIALAGFCKDVTRLIEK